MSEDNVANIIIALITATGSIVGGYIGARATIIAAEMKAKSNQTPSNNGEKPSLWSGIFGGAVVGAALTLVVLFLLGVFHTEKSKIDAITGTWIGTAKNGDFEFDAKFTIGKSCNIGFVCGTFDFPAISCSGTITITKIDGNLFIAQPNDRTSGCFTTPDIQESLQLLPDGSLLYISKSSSYGETRAILNKSK
ncbi:MAG TPA: hypothetical protein VN653_16170 [Anaerolineales bacterium]|nr:hypothetical protein [Anaerolineales bacterium]